MIMDEGYLLDSEACCNQSTQTPGKPSTGPVVRTVAAERLRKDGIMTGYSVLMLAGEASGDYHAAALVEELRTMVPDLAICGIGGDRMERAGVRLLRHYKDVNTIGFSEGLGRFRAIMDAYAEIKAEIRSGAHDLFIPVDYPDINIRLCLFARRAGLPVCYYVSPQVWAWRKGRVRKIARRVDRMMTLFPFEEEFYRKSHVNADFVGHTMVKDIPATMDRTAIRDELGLPASAYVVALAPGSRPAEIKRMAPRMRDAAGIFAQRFPDSRFVLPLAAAHLHGPVSDALRDAKVPVIVTEIDAAKVMGAADCGLVTSGTATLQAALAGMPHALVYVLDDLSWKIAMNVVKPLFMDKDLHIGLANILAIYEEKQGRGPIVDMVKQGIHIPCQECGRPLFIPEVIQHRADPDRLANWLTSFRVDDKLREVTREGFRKIRSMLEIPAGGKTAAGIVRDTLTKTSSHRTPRP